jgi:hypothetical protein
MPTIQQLLESQEKEFENNFPFLNEVKFTPFYGQDFEKAKMLTKIYTNLGDKIIGWHKQSVIALYEAEIELCESKKKNISCVAAHKITKEGGLKICHNCSRDAGYNQAIEERVSHYKQVIEELRK